MRKKTAYKVKMTYPNGRKDYLLDYDYETPLLFKTRQEATEAAEEEVTACMTGAEVLNMSDPVENPYDEKEMLNGFDFEIIEVTVD